MDAAGTATPSSHHRHRNAIPALNFPIISVHGYETSGVQGAVLFLTSRAAEYTSKYNIVVCPCVSPWGYVGTVGASGATIY